MLSDNKNPYQNLTFKTPRNSIMIDILISIILFRDIVCIFLQYFSEKKLTFYDKAKLVENYSFRFSIHLLKIPLI